MNQSPLSRGRKRPCPPPVSGGGWLKAGRGVVFLLCSFFFCVPAFALRLVSLKPNITLTLISLGFADDIVGITKFCQRPNTHAKVVADYMNVQSESILRLKPDVVFSSTENSQSRQYEALRAAGVRIELLSFKTWSDFLKSADTMCRELKKNPSDCHIASDLEKRIHDLKTAVPSWQGKNFVVIVQRQPLMVAAGATYISTLFTELGLQNAFQDNAVAYPVLDEETLLRRHPDLIFDMSYGSDAGKPYLGQAVMTLNIDHFLAAPQSVDALTKLLAIP